MIEIAKRDIKSYFYSPIGYVCIAALWALTGFFFFQMLTTGSSSYITDMFSALFTWRMMIIPIITMRSFSEEKRSRTEQTLLTEPVSIAGIVGGKFLACYTIYGMIVLGSMIPCIVLTFIGQPAWGIIFGNILASLLYGSAMTAIGVFISSLTASQTIAAVGTLAASVFLLLIDSVRALTSNGIVVEAARWISFTTRYLSFTQGMFNVANAVFFLSVSVLFLFLTIRHIERRRGNASGLLTSGVLLIIFLLNLMFSLLDKRFPYLSIDMSEDKKYTLSEEAVLAAEEVEIPISISILVSENDAKDDSILSEYGIQYSQVAVLIEKFHAKNSLIHVNYVDLDCQPGFLSNEKYMPYDPGVGSVILESEYRVKVLNLSDLFLYAVEQNTGEVKYFEQVDGALSSGLRQVSVKEVPTIAIAVGSHAEMLGDSLGAFRQLMENNQFNCKTFDLLKEQIPSDAEIVMLPTPTSDYTEKELWKLDQFLKDDIEGDRSIWVVCHPSQPELPALSGFLEEWGVRILRGVLAETDTNRVLDANPIYFLSDVPEEKRIHEEIKASFLVTPASCALESVFETNNGIVTRTLAETSESAILRMMDEASAAEETKLQKSYQTVMMSERIMDVDQTGKRVIVFGSSTMFLDEYISGNTFDNGAFLIDVARYATGVSDSRVGTYIQRQEITHYDIAAPFSTRVFWGLGVFTILIPVFVFMTGIVIYLRRRHL